MKIKNDVKHRNQYVLYSLKTQLSGSFEVIVLNHMKEVLINLGFQLFLYWIHEIIMMILVEHNPSDKNVLFVRQWRNIVSNISLSNTFWKHNSSILHFKTIYMYKLIISFDSACILPFCLLLLVIVQLYSYCSAGFSQSCFHLLMVNYTFFLFVLNHAQDF